MLWLFVPLLLQGPTEGLPEPAARLAEAARSAPPELAADILIRLAESTLVRTRQAKRALLEEAFERAEGARYLVGVLSTGPQTATREASLERALGAGLSRMGLRLRAVQAMNGIDRAQAVALFQRIGRPEAGLLSCSATSTPHIEPYYRTLHTLLRNGFTPLLLDRGLDARIVEGLLRDLSSPLELEPLAMILADPRWKKPQLEAMAASFSTALKRLNADPLSFQRAAAGTLQQRIFELNRRLWVSGIPVYGLIEAWRSFLVRHLGGVRCESEQNVFLRQEPLIRITRAFNEQLRQLSGAGSQLPPISEEQGNPSRSEVAARPFDYWQSDRASQVLRRAGPALLVDLDRWSKDHSEPEADFFHQACAMLEAAAVGPYRAAVREQWIAVLKASPLRRASPAEWLAGLRPLLPDWAESGDPLMDLYGELEKLAPERH